MHKRRAFLIACCCAGFGLALGGCPSREANAPGPAPSASSSSQATENAATSGTSDVSAATTQASALSAEAADGEVLDVVFNDLLSLDDSPLAVRRKAPAEIRLVGAASSYPRKVESVLMRHEKKQWDALTPAQLAAATEAAQALVRRHEAREAFPPPGWPHDARVKLVAAPSTGPATLPWAMDRPVYAYLPGYSADHRFAVVALGIPWSIHHADATYLLGRRADGGWQIVLRQFVYYV